MKQNITFQLAYLAVIIQGNTHLIIESNLTTSLTDNIDIFIINFFLSVSNCCSSKSSDRQTRSSEQTIVPSNEDIRSRIVSGDDAIQGEFPYQVCKHMKNHFTAAQITLL